MRLGLRHWCWLGAALACTREPGLAKVVFAQPQVSRGLQLSADGAALWVVNPEADSVSELDLAGRTLRREIALGPRPTVAARSLRFDPGVRPRAIALVEARHKAYIAGEAAGAILVLDTLAGHVTARIPVGAGPVAVVASPDGRAVFAVSHEAAEVVEIDPTRDVVVATRGVAEHPWGASLSADGRLLFVTHLLRNPGISVIATHDFGGGEVRVTGFPALAPAVTPDRPSGESRGAFAVVPQPGTGTLWVPHLLLATTTPQPTLDFQSTVFPAFTLLTPEASTLTDRLLFRPSSTRGTPDLGAFADVVSGPRDLAFTPDGAFARVADEQSEDVLVFDATEKVEAALLRPTPAGMPEGLVVDATGERAFLWGRNTHDVTVLRLAEGGAADGGPRRFELSVEGAPIDCLAGPDPMPDSYRRGQRLFSSSNSARFPLSQNFWLGCASCHLEGGTDAVTWRFLEGPRDTPSNAGGPSNTGFLWRQAVRNTMADYDETIRTEQGGHYSRSDPAQQRDLKALADFTNYAIPFPPNPNVGDAGLSAAQARGKQLFGAAEANCVRCHAGAFYTDSGAGNPGLDLRGPIVLHDMTGYTCVKGGPFKDRPAQDVEGHPRTACAFDTPTLRGIFATAPYLHDGSAATLEQAIGRMPGGADLSEAEQSDLAAFLKTL